MNYPQQGLVAANDERYITPTKTVCYAWTAPGVLPKLEGKVCTTKNGLLYNDICPYGWREIARIIVREELV